jgi:hypothetical protein
MSTFSNWRPGSPRPSTPWQAVQRSQKISLPSGARGALPLSTDAPSATIATVKVIMENVSKNAMDP